MYNTIINPDNDKLVLTDSKVGKTIINKYIKMIGGSSKPKRDLSAAKHRRRIQKLKTIAESREYSPLNPYIELDTNYLKETYRYRAIISNILKTEIRDYYKSIYGRYLNKSEITKLQPLKKSFKIVNFDVSSSENTIHGLDILPNKYVYGVDTERYEGYILEKIPFNSNASKSLIPLGYILDDLEYDIEKQDSLLPLGYIWGFSPDGVVPMYVESTKQNR